MKKLLLARLPIIIATMSLLIVSGFLRYNLSLRSQQIAKEFKSQNMHEIYSIDTLKISSRLNSYSASINWVCIEAEVNKQPFFKMSKEKCSSGLFTQREILHIKEANNLKIAFTIKLENEIEILYVLFLIFQTLLIISLIISTKRSENEKLKNEHELIEFARQTYHDIRSPLDVLKTILIERNLENENQLILQRSLNRINEIANSLLDKTRNNKTIGINNSPSKLTNLEAIALEIIEEKKLLFPNVRLNIQGSSGSKLSGSIWADINQVEFKRVLSNLINNSIEAGSNEITIYIKLNKNKELILQLVDNGPGFPKEIIESADLRSLTSKNSGNGLGLSHAFNFARTNKVELSLKNLEIGAEVSFQFQNILAKSQIILLDDDSLTRLNWELKAKQNLILLRTFANSNDLFMAENQIKIEDFIYVDCELKNESGVDVAKKLDSMGFQNIFLCTGHPPENFSHLTFLKGVIGKSPPF